MDIEALINTVCMDSSKNEMIFLVEGDCDRDILASFMVKNKTYIYPCGGKENVVEVFKELCNRRHAMYVYALLDIDYDWYFDQTLSEEHVVYTDKHDFDIMIFSSECFERVVANIYSKDKLENFGSVELFRQHLIDIALRIGLLRIYDKENNLNLKFKPIGKEKELKYSKFINKTNFVGDDVMIDTVKHYFNQKPDMNNAAVIERMNNIASRCVDKEYFVIHGHDVASIMATIWKDMPKSNTKFDSRENIEACLRSAYCFDNFKQTKMFESLSLLALKQGVNIWKNYN